MADELNLKDELKKGLDGVAVTTKAAIDAKATEITEAAKADLAKAEKRIEDLESAKADLEKQVNEVEVRVKESSNEAKAKTQTFDDVLTKAIEDNHDNLKKFQRGETKSLNIELKAVGDVTTANVTGSTVWGAINRVGIIEAPKRKVHMRQVIPGGSVGAGTDYYFMRENGPGEGAIAPVAEGALKPQIDVDLVEASVKIETIAGWLRISNKALNNIPGMISFLRSRLPEKLLRVEDQQVLYGTGVTPQIKGILTAGNFIDSTAPLASPLVEKIILDIAELEDTYERDATAILMRPADYYGFFLNKATGSGEYDLPANVAFINGVLYISGVPTFASTALTSPDYIVGDFQMGAQILTQEAMTLRFFEQDGINVRENMTTVRIEESIALPVYGPDYFIKGSTALTT